MITTTTYTERLTITTADDGTRTTSRTTSADTTTAYLFSELSPEAQQHAAEHAAEEEANAYYAGQWWSHTQSDIDEIWEAFRSLRNHQPISSHDHYSSFFLTVDNAEKVTAEQNTGICWSMDICNAWNEYAAAVQLLIEEAEDNEAETWSMEAPYYWDGTEVPEDIAEQIHAHEEHADRCREKADELSEKAVQAVESTIKELIEGIESYYQSTEFWYEWLDDGETRFTREGERI